MRILATMIACTLLCSGCATIVRGTTQTWSVQTDPAGATVKLSSGEQCTSPCSILKHRTDQFSVTIDKAGYDQSLTYVMSSMKTGGAVGIAGNVLIGGLIGIGVDAASGATKDLSPNPLIVRLTPARPGQAPAVYAAPAASDTAPANGNSGAWSINHYGDAATASLAKMQCAGNVKFVRSMEGQEVYQGTCTDHHVETVECNSVSCR